jgi:hypothetical protein
VATPDSLLCPLMAVVHQASPQQSAQVKANAISSVAHCKGNKCAWWVAGVKPMCAITFLALTTAQPRK